MLGFNYKSNQLFCEDLAVDDIVDQAGSPLYIYSKNAFLERYNAVQSAFSAVVDTTVCYSVKCCSNINILKVLAEAGCGFDIVSGGELHRVMKAGGNPKKVAFAGVSKTDAEIRYALECGIMLFNAESEEEVRNIDRIAGDMGVVAPVALRINPDIDAKTHAKTTTAKKENKFGIDFSYAMQFMARLSELKNTVLKGVDVHIGSPVNSLDPYREASERIVDFAKICPDTVEYLDIGGGYGLLYNDEEVPDFAAYAEAIGTAVKAAGKKLIIEPGRSIAGNSGILVGEVQYRKNYGVKSFVMLDAGMQNLIRPAMYDAYHFIWPTKTEDLPESRLFPELQGGGGILMPQDVVGPICESSDVFCKDRPLPDMQRGDRVAIFSAGAYGMAMSSNYNSHPRPAEVLVDGGEFRVIRKRESWEDITALEENI